MSYSAPEAGSLKRKRRTRREPPQIQARLEFVETAKDEAAVLSDDIAQALGYENVSAPDAASCVAVCQWLPPKAVSLIPAKWTLLPYRSSSLGLAAGTIQISTQSRHGQALLSAVHPASITRLRSQNPSVQVSVTTATAIQLDSVYVSVDRDEVREHDQVQLRYGGGFIPKKRSIRNLKDRIVPQVQARTKEDIQALVRASLPTEGSLLRAGDMLNLALPTHPVTHAAPPRASVTVCEPTTQGLLSSDTRIVVLLRNSSPDTNERSTTVITLPNPIRDSPLLQEADEDTANEAFYTAEEDDDQVDATAQSQGQAAITTSDTEDDSDEDNLSDDPEDMITLTSPALGTQASGLLSALTSATPRPFLKSISGMHTPGSVYSAMTSTTFRGGQPRRTKVLKAQGLLQRIPDELLHPRPSDHEDEEARVYVETSILARLGCFSGDWIELSEAPDPALTGIASIGLAAFDKEEQRAGKSRCVKVYGLPELLSSKPASRPAVQGRTRSDSLSSIMPIPSVPILHVSPILLANLDNPAFLRLTPMRSPETSSTRISGKMPTASSPPVAKEASLIKVQSPISTDKAADMTIMNRLVNYFEAKQRLVKSGDLVAITIDEVIGRAVFDGSSADAAPLNDLLHFFESQSYANETQKPAGSHVIWFQIGQITSSATAEDEDSDDPWYGLVTIVPAKTKMHQSGTEKRRIPPARESAWPIYQGVVAYQRPGSTRHRGLAAVSSTPMSSLQRRLRELLSIAASPRAIHLGLPPCAILIHSTQRNIGKSFTTQQACRDLGIHCFVLNAFDILTEAASGGSDNNTVGLLESRADRALQCGAENTCLLLQHIEVLDSARIFASIKDKLGELRVLVATTTEIDKIPENIRGLFTHELELSAPDEAEREAILQSVIARSVVSVAPSVQLSSIAVKTAALVAGDLVQVVERAISARDARLQKVASTASTATTNVTIRDLELAGGEWSTKITSVDFDIAVDEARKNFADSIGAPKIPNVQWSDVGGLANVKDAVMETIQLPLSRPELFAKGLKKRSGILFYGPPGTGKTLLAKAIATEFSLNFFSVKGPELLNMYIGESEANVRRVFQRARDARPCVVFFDELDSVAPKRGNQGDSGGVMDRIVSQLLAELDGMSDGDDENGNGGGAGVFVIGATNRPDLLDQALLRPGRFDKMLYLGISDTHEKQQKIMEALTRKFTLDPSLQLSSVAASLPFTYTGADLYALCSDAMLKAVTRSARAVDERVAQVNAQRQNSTNPHRPPITIAQFFDHHARPSDLEVIVTQADFLAAKSELVPSVSAEELRHYERVRRDFEGDRTEKQKAPGPASGQMQIRPRPNGTATNQPSLPQPSFATVADIEAWQARKIEELMHAGFSDGSLARNNPKPAQDDGRDVRIPYRNGMNLPVQQDEEGEDMVVRTGRLGLADDHGAEGGMRKSSAGSGSGSGTAPARESRIFGSASAGGLLPGRDKGKSGEKQSKGKRAMSLFSSSAGKGKGKEKERQRQKSADVNGGQAGVNGFGDAAGEDDRLYD